MEGGKSEVSRRRSRRDQEVPERVTLKKEIGVLSACTIIIGEETPPREETPPGRRVSPSRGGPIDQRGSYRGVL